MSLVVGDAAPSARGLSGESLHTGARTNANGVGKGYVADVAFDPTPHARTDRSGRVSGARAAAFRRLLLVALLGG